MKDKRSSTEDKIWILREVDDGKNVLESCPERNIAPAEIVNRARLTAFSPVLRRSSDFTHSD
jgi:hypothetical protein